MQSQTISVPKIGTIPALTLTQSYTYDELNRLETAQEKKGAVVQWQQVFKYDRYGNRTFDTTTGQTTAGFEGLNPSISAVNNQISKSGYRYDAVGNMTLDELDHTYQYDAENHLKSYDGGVGAAYTYDGEGHRVKKVTGNGTLSTTFVYDAEGKLVAEYATNTGSSDVGARYLTQDALGSTRVVTTSSSKAPTALNAASLVTSRSDYLPFGEEIKVGVGGRVQAQGYLYGSGVVDNTRQKFTGKERDDETGLDYFGARYYANTQGRFTSVDPVKVTKARMLDPQRFNLYAYVRNNPLIYVDPNGEDVESYVLLTSGPNYSGYENNEHVSNVQTLGPKDYTNGALDGAYLALNVQVNFTAGDSPNNYTPERVAYVVNASVQEGATRSGSVENPESYQYKNSGQSQFIFDAPGPQGDPGQLKKMNGVTDMVFEVSEKNKKTGEVSTNRFYYRVQIEVHNGQINQVAAYQISKKEFDKLTGKDKDKEEKKKKDGEDEKKKKNS